MDRQLPSLAESLSTVHIAAIRQKPPDPNASIARRIFESTVEAYEYSGDDSKFAAGLLETVSCETQILARMNGGHLGPNASFPDRHNGI